MSLKNLNKFNLLEGDLKVTPFAAVLGLARFVKATGTLTARRDKVSKTLYIFHGIPIYCRSDLPADSLRQSMLKSGKINRNNVLEVEKIFEAERIEEDRALIRLGIIDEALRHRELQALTMKRILTIFEWSAGTYTFTPGDDFIEETDLFDLDPLDLIHEGISTYQATSVASDIQEISNLDIEKKGDWNELEGFFERYNPDTDVKSITSGRMKVLDAIPKLTKDVNRSLALVYELIVSGYLALDGKLIGENAPKIEPIKSSPEKSYTPPPVTPRPIISPSKAPEPPASFKKKVLKSYEETSREQAARQANPAIKSRTPTPGPGSMDIDLLRRFEAMLEIVKRGDYFEMLGVTPDTDRAEIKKAFFSKNQQFHADRARPLGPPGIVLAERIHDGLAKACDTLIDADMRYAYEMSMFKNESAQAWSIELKKELAKKQGHRAMWYLSHKRPELAYDFFDSLVKLDAENARNYAFLGWTLYCSDKNRSAEARGFLKTALNINPKLTEGFLLLGWIEKDAGNMDEAQNYFKQSFDADHHNKWAKAELENMKSPKQKTEGIFGKLFKK